MGGVGTYLEEVDSKDWGGISAGKVSQWHNMVEVGYSKELGIVDSG